MRSIRMSKIQDLSQQEKEQLSVLLNESEEVVALYGKTDYRANKFEKLYLFKESFYLCFEDGILVGGAYKEGVTSRFEYETIVLHPSMRSIPLGLCPIIDFFVTSPTHKGRGIEKEILLRLCQDFLEEYHHEEYWNDYAFKMENPMEQYCVYLFCTSKTPVEYYEAIGFERSKSHLVPDLEVDFELLLPVVDLLK